MRKIIAFDRVSADGYFSTLEGGLDWAVPDDELDAAAAANLTGPGTLLFGRRTYEMFEAFWPTALDASPTSPDPHAEGRRSPAIRAMAIWINAATKLVLSRTRKAVPWTNSRVLGALEPQEITALKQQPGAPIMLFGSGTIASQLTAHGLIDEYHFVVSPILLGDGRSLLGDVGARVRLQLIEARPTAAGNVTLRYARCA